MQDTHDQRAPQASAARFVTDRELAPVIGVSVGFLQKDRREAQRIPYVKLGDRCLYDMDEALAAVRALTVGGPRRARRSGGSASERASAPADPTSAPAACSATTPIAHRATAWPTQLRRGWRQTAK